ncbi:hypothetical protein [Prosthecobacter sp.]|uniref:hypothetical protein n=1 Tax=Prosthecobacter sp. TaxID=1965333 RepID=UPI0025CF8BC0|nr:hypothetical protein [Prosthecobacter sp.]
MKILLLPIFLFAVTTLQAEMLAGVARIDITERTGPVNDPCYAKALVLRSGETTAVLITVDAVAIGGIGRIGNGFLANVRGELERDLGIPPTSVVINASHCHGIIRADTQQLVVQVVKEAAKKLVPVKAGAGVGSERRISENRRLLMKDGTQIDMRRAYSMPRDEDVASVGPIDPQIGLLRLDRADGTPLAIVYQFACHPIMNPPSKGCSADYPGFASKVIEQALGGGAMAFFIQGCGGDINPVRYKEVTRPADAEPLGTMLGASVLAATRQIQTGDESTLKVSNEVISVPRAADYENRIASIEAEQKKLLAALKPTNINFKTFLPLLIEQKLSPDFPSHYSQSYLHDQELDRKAIPQLDADNRALVESYLANIEVMERLTRLNTNLALLKRHLAETKAAAKPVLDVEVCGLRVGDFKLVTFPGELTVQIGLNIKSLVKDPHAFVSGYTNGYIYYTPTVFQRTNTGYAQEDCDSLVAPEWQKIFESKAVEVIRNLGR